MIPASHFIRCVGSNDSPQIANIQQLREKLVQAVDEHKSFTAQPVVQLSQELDGYILEFQKYSLRREVKNDEASQMAHSM
ncbi:aspartyl-phosphate phosphatase Spo0E family protein [Paenibacillus sp. 481]|uniref:aspartyl-phosphate phosphatase Spo0E family protein n=1 Tax=Paenibacillus sp. 481 TaxID=2835869 RepID=UPI001E4D165E|nr:aspartyl-phosphate phosphatase Spo0E family protein [Paenibacillus sp. 481]UHA73764.1 aspartyl-phosphate phosphatase Spo0E family protein [Paenibacillus sp. 481]